MAALKRDDRLASLAARLSRTVRFLALGPTLLMIVAAAVMQSRASCRRSQPRMLGITLPALLAAAIVAAILPLPTFRQYMLPILPPLVLLLAVHAEQLIAWFRQRRIPSRIATALLCASILAGCGRSVWSALTQPLDRRPIAVEHHAHELGRFGARLGGGLIAGIDQLPLIDSGFEVDPRFATGPFLFRAGNLRACRDRALCPATFSRTERLDRDKPRFVLTGIERHSPKRMAGGMDRYLDHWARKHGYGLIKLEHGRDLWIARRSTMSGGNFSAYDGHERQAHQVSHR